MGDKRSDLPLLPPDRTCNARLARGDGDYCKNPAGGGTDHPGVGRCRLHGGLSPRAEGADGPLDMFRAMGLGRIITMAETMTEADQEYLMHVSTNALVVTRAGILARLQTEGLTPREMNDLTNALTRVDNLLAKHPNTEDPDAAPASPAEDGYDEELARLAELESRT